MNRIKRRAKKLQGKPERTPEAYTLPDFPTTAELLEGFPTTAELLKSFPTIDDLPECNFDDMPTFSKKELERIRLDAMKVLEQAKEQLDKLFLN